MEQSPASLPANSGKISQRTGGLLAPDEQPAFTEYRPDGGRALLIVCDHAANTVPRSLQDLGLTAEQRQGHIAWDPGSAEVTRLLAVALDAPAVLTRYSRLVIDCNRAPDDPTAMPLISDDVIVPGNRDLDDAERATRTAACHTPYHDAVAGKLDAMQARFPLVALFSVHSFTPSMRDGSARPWDAGVLWTDDGRIPLPLMAALRQDSDLLIGDNEPYSAHDLYGYTVETHAQPRGLPNGLIEIRQDHLAVADGPRRWADLLAQALDPILHSLGI